MRAVTVMWDFWWTEWQSGKFFYDTFPRNITLVLCIRQGPCFPARVRQGWEFHEKSWSKLITISKYREKFLICLEISREVLSGNWQYWSNPRALPTASFVCRGVRIVAKSAFYLRHFRPSERINAGYGFPLNFISGTSIKIGRRVPYLLKIGQRWGQFTWRP